MRIAELTDKQKNVNVEVKVIWDKAEPKEMFGKKIKSVLVADIDSVQGDGSPTAYLDIYDNDIDQIKHLDKIRVINAYAKLIQNNKRQFRIVNAHKIEVINEQSA